MVRFCGGSWLRTNVLNFCRVSPNIRVLVPKMVQFWRKWYHFLARRSRNPPPNWFGPVLFPSYDYMGWVRIIILQIMIRFWCDIWLRTNVLNFGRFPRIYGFSSPKWFSSEGNDITSWLAGVEIPHRIHSDRFYFQAMTIWVGLG